MKNIDLILTGTAIACLAIFGYGWVGGATKNLSLYGWAAGSAVTAAAVGGRYLWKHVPTISTGEDKYPDEDALCQLYRMRMDGRIAPATFVMAVKEIVSLED